MLKKYYHLTSTGGKGKILLAKCARLSTFETGLKKLKDYNPQVKVILIIRNPVERTYSGYQMDKDIAGHEFTVEELKKADKQ